MKQDSKTAKNENNIQLIFGALKKLINPPPQPRKRIGFKPEIKLGVEYYKQQKNLKEVFRSLG